MALKVHWEAVLQDRDTAVFVISVIGINDYATAESVANRVLSRGYAPTEWARDGGVDDLRVARSPVISARRWTLGDDGVRLRMSGFIRVKDAETAMKTALAEACNCGDGEERRGAASVIEPLDGGCLCDEGDESKAFALVHAEKLVTGIYS